MLLILLASFVGYCILRQFLKIENYIILLPGSFLFGTLISGTFLYVSDLLFVYTMKNYAIGNILFIILSTIYIGWYYYRFYALDKTKEYFLAFWRDKIALVMLICFLTYSFWFSTFSFGFNNGNIEIRGGAWSDILYHHSFARSITLGDNIPTTYPYFANTKINYHFMFNYYAGKVAMFGLNTIHALNIMSALSLAFLLLLLFEFGRKYFQSNAVGVITPILLVFHSSVAAFKWIFKNPLESIFHKTGWLQGVPYEAWGLFNFSVFMNQRHLAFGLAICVFLVIYLILERDNAVSSKNDIFNKESIIRNISLGLLIGIIPYWNIIVSVICIVFICLIGISEFKRNKQVMFGLLFSAFIASLVALPQLLMFKSGDTVLSEYPIFRPGYEIENLGVLTFLQYYYKVLGIKFILIFASIIFVSWRKKLDFLFFLTPFVIANLWQLGKIRYDNNKLMIIWLMFANCFAAYMIVKLYNLSTYFRELLINKQNNKDILNKKITSNQNYKNLKTKLQKPSLNLTFIVMSNDVFKWFAELLFISIILAGVIDMFALKNLPVVKIKDEASYVKKWIVQNTKRDSIFLTSNFIPNYDNAITAVTLSGRMLYCVRNDVDSSVKTVQRMENIKKIFTFEEGLDKTIELIKREKINYILVDSVLRKTKDFKVDEEMFLKNFKLEYKRRLEYNNQDVLIFSLK